MTGTHRRNDTTRAWSGVLAVGMLVAMTVSVVTASMAGNVAAANAQTSPHHVVAVGGSHACVIYGATSALRCWGDNTYGQLGVANVSTFTPNPKVPTGVSGVVDVATGTSHTCAALSTGAVKCWGTNSHGQLGRGNTFSDSSHPTPTAPCSATAPCAAGVPTTPASWVTTRSSPLVTPSPLPASPVLWPSPWGQHTVVRCWATAP